MGTYTNYYSSKDNKNLEPKKFIQTAFGKP